MVDINLLLYQRPGIDVNLLHSVDVGFSGPPVIRHSNYITDYSFIPRLSKIFLIIDWRITHFTLTRYGSLQTNQLLRRMFTSAFVTLVKLS